MPEQSRQAVSCTCCGQPLWDTYYGVFGRLACERCHDEARVASTQDSGVGRFLRATLLGSLAGAAASAIWYAVSALTGYVFSPVALVVGMVVGGAVLRGSQHRGGWPYQVLAVCLTYVAIMGAYAPAVTKGLFGRTAVSAREETAAGPARPAAAAADEADRGPVTLGVSRGVAVIAVTLALPLLGLFGTMGLAMIAMAVIVAAAMNHRPAPAFEGPYPVNPPAGFPPPGLGV